MKQISIALAGNPNAGKTTIFNTLTGSRQHVGNWPGKTVEKKKGSFPHDGYEIQVTDLPGTYSLSAYSPEEVIARDYIINERPSVVLIVVDAANLERNLYLAVQVLELEVPAVLVLNMMDAAQAKGYQIDVGQISRLLGIPVVTTIARKGVGIQEMVETVINVAEKKREEGHPQISQITQM